MNADEYTKMFSLEDHYWWFVARRRLALSLLRARFVEGSTPKILDLGCGTGVVSRELQEWSRPVGLDMSALALKYCRQRGLEQVVRGDAIRLPFETSSLQGIIGLDIFEHIEYDRRAFLEANRVLAPGGWLVMSVPAFKWLWGPHDVALMHHRRYRKNQVRRELQEAGFLVDRVSYSVFFLFPIVVFWRLCEKLKKGPAKASLVAVPECLNRFLINLQELEAALIRKFDLPLGSSVVAVAHKPEA